MLIKTTRFGEVEVKNINNLRGGLNSKVEKIIKEIKGQTTVKEVVGHFWQKGCVCWNGHQINFIVTGEESMLMEVPDDLDQDALYDALDQDEIVWGKED